MSFPKHGILCCQLLVVLLTVEKVSENTENHKGKILITYYGVSTLEDKIL